MGKIKSFFSSVPWTFFVSRRFSCVDRKGKSKITSFLASLGICFGVMTLICVISVMNGFQMSFIDAIMEVNSFHIRGSGNFYEKNSEFENFCREQDEIRVFFPFYETQSLLVGRNGNQSASLIRSIPKNIMEIDEGFKREAKIWAGNFDLEEDDSIVLGTELARRLGVRVGSRVNLFALAGGNDVSLISEDRFFTVKGIFRTGYADINASCAFISLEDGKKYFGKDINQYYAIKLVDSERDLNIVEKLTSSFPEMSFESWKSYNRSFFSTLRIEKNMLFLLVFIIFVVVAINIFNGMRRIVLERREEISLLSALGGKNLLIQFIFVFQGFLIGIKGAFPGVVLGLLLSCNMNYIFAFLSKLSYFFQLIFTSVFSPQNAVFVAENPMFRVYGNIPPRILLDEVLIIAVFGIFSSMLASFFASRGILNLTVAEVMRDE